VRIHHATNSTISNPSPDYPINHQINRSSNYQITRSSNYQIEVLTVHDLPAVNATLNALSGILLLIGYLLIRARRVEQHRKFMIAAFATSALFLVCYVIYHAQVGSVRFTRQGFVRPLYFAILITHVTLAAIVLPMAILTLSRGLQGRYAPHRTIARWTFPVWLYVSVTGVLVYVLLYQPTWLL
jgi:putative membrane protein